MATTIVERESSGSGFLALLIVLLVIGGLAFAYWGGWFGTTKVIENNNTRTIEKTTVVPAAEPAKPAPAPANP